MSDQISNEVKIETKAFPRYFFLHFFAIIMLYLSVTSLITMLFQYVNNLIPDPVNLAQPYFQDSSFNLIRLAIASLIIIFPLLVWSSWYLGKKYLENQAISQMRIRKWLIYFTLFTAALIIVGDLVRIIFVFLQGEMKSRFILKALSMLIVCGLVFRYYLWDLKERFPFKKRYFVLPISILILVAVVSGFFIVGSPTTGRLRRFDQQRINDLQNIQYQIINYWQSKTALPKQLSDLNDTISGFIEPLDPEKGQPYEYNIKGETTFELCAVFNQAGKTEEANNVLTMPAPVAKQNNWQHDIGRTCFPRTIDKELYPPFQKLK